MADIKALAEELVNLTVKEVVEMRSGQLPERSGTAGRIQGLYSIHRTRDRHPGPHPLARSRPGPDPNPAIAWRCSNRLTIPPASGRWTKNSWRSSVRKFVRTSSRAAPRIQATSVPASAPWKLPWPSTTSSIRRKTRSCGTWDTRPMRTRS